MSRLVAFVLRNRLAFRVTWLVYAFALFAGTHMSIPHEFDELVTSWDKLIHAGAYFGLGVLTALAFIHVRLAVLIPCLMAYAVIDELLQAFVDRTPDVSDWMSDSAGILLAVLLVQGLARYGSRPPRFSEPAIVPEPELAPETVMAESGR